MLFASKAIEFASEAIISVRDSMLSGPKSILETPKTTFSGVEAVVCVTEITDLLDRGNCLAMEAMVSVIEVIASVAEAIAGGLQAILIATNKVSSSQRQCFPLRTRLPLRRRTLSLSRRKAQLC